MVCRIISGAKVHNSLQFTTAELYCTRQESTTTHRILKESTLAALCILSLLHMIYSQPIFDKDEPPNGVFRILLNPYAYCVHSVYLG